MVIAATTATATLAPLGSMTIFKAVCTTRSRTVGMPNGRFSVLRASMI
jgi:hypothetical protein